MPPHTFEQLLTRAAELCGVDPGFWDIWGKYHETELPAKQAILRAKGFDATNTATLERSLAKHTRGDWDRLLPSSVVTGEAATLELPVNVRSEWVAEAASFTVRAEDGSTAEFALNLR